MDLTPYLPWIVFAHVLGAFLFAAGHGVSMFVIYQLRKEHDRARIGGLLDVSAWSLNVAGIGLLVLLVAGILAGVVAGSFGRAWIWVSLVLLVVIGGVMTPLAAIPLNKVRMGMGIRVGRMKKSDPDPVPVADAELAAMLTALRPEVLLALGGGGFLVILWLMMFRPF